MLYLDLLMTLAIVLVLTFGYEPTSPRALALALVAGVGVLVAAHFILAWLLGRMGNILTGMSERRRLPSRRRMIRLGDMRTTAERRLDSLADDALRAWIETHPADTLASEILCERLRRAGRWDELAREMQYLLAVAGTTENADAVPARRTERPTPAAARLCIEEKCTLYHRLADLYLERLHRPDRARETLAALVAEFPRHYQATLARRRLESLAAAGPGRAGETPDTPPRKGGPERMADGE
ncbi:MAG: hypothetical protein M1457_10840 [bacterium]|nr:hypothetical protein [bacterium]